MTWTQSHMPHTHTIYTRRLATMAHTIVLARTHTACHVNVLGCCCENIDPFFFSSQKKALNMCRCEWQDRCYRPGQCVWHVLCSKFMNCASVCVLCLRLRLCSQLAHIAYTRCLLIAYECVAPAKQFNIQHSTCANSVCPTNICQSHKHAVYGANIATKTLL